MYWASVHVRYLYRSEKEVKDLRVKYNKVNQSATVLRYGVLKAKNQ